METKFHFESGSEIIKFINSKENLIETGWETGLNYIQEILNRLSLYIEPEKYYKDFNPFVTGIFYDIGLVCSGVPECWLDLQQAFNNGSFWTQEPNDQKRQINLGFNTTFGDKISNVGINEQGAIMAVFAFLLETTGRTTSITQYSSFSSENLSFQGSIILKKPNEPLDLNFLSFWLVNQTFLKNTWTLLFKKITSSTRSFFYNSNHGREDNDVFINDKIKPNEEWLFSSLEKLKINYRK